MQVTANSASCTEALPKLHRSESVSGAPRRTHIQLVPQACHRNGRRSVMQCLPVCPRKPAARLQTRAPPEQRQPGAPVANPFLAGDATRAGAGGRNSAATLAATACQVGSDYAAVIAPCKREQTGKLNMQKKNTARRSMVGSILLRGS